MALWDLPNPWLWGITAGVLNFIPYVGPTITLMVISVVSLVSMEGYGTAVGAASSFLLLTTIEGQIIQPLLIGFRLNLNPIILFVTIWFAGWFWGVAGIFLAMPILIAVKEIAAYQTGATLLKSILVRPDAPIRVSEADDNVTSAPILQTSK
jgi:predicted PurR-regulated permease PerM